MRRIRIYRFFMDRGTIIAVTIVVILFLLFFFWPYITSFLNLA